MAREEGVDLEESGGCDQNTYNTLKELIKIIKSIHVHLNTGKKRERMDYKYSKPFSFFLVEFNFDTSHSN